MRSTARRGTSRSRSVRTGRRCRNTSTSWYEDPTDGYMIDPEPLPLTVEDYRNIKAVNTMLAIARGRRAEKREPWYRSAGQHLALLRHGKGVEIWAEVCRKHIGIGLARAYELCAIGAGRTSQAELRREKGASTRRWKASIQRKKRGSEATPGA